MKELFRQPNRSNILLCRYYLYNDKSLFKKKKITISYWAHIQLLDNHQHKSVLSSLGGCQGTSPAGYFFRASPCLRISSACASYLWLRRVTLAPGQHRLFTLAVITN